MRRPGSPVRVAGADGGRSRSPRATRRHGRPTGAGSLHRRARPRRVRRRAAPAGGPRCSARSTANTAPSSGCAPVRRCTCWKPIGLTNPGPNTATRGRPPRGAARALRWSRTATRPPARCRAACEARGPARRPRRRSRPVSRPARARPWRRTPSRRCLVRRGRRLCHRWSCRASVAAAPGRACSSRCWPRSRAVRRRWVTSNVRSPDALRRCRRPRRWSPPLAVGVVAAPTARTLTFWRRYDRGAVARRRARVSRCRRGRRERSGWRHRARTSTFTVTATRSCFAIACGELAADAVLGGDEGLRGDELLRVDAAAPRPCREVVRVR